MPSFLSEVVGSSTASRLIWMALAILFATATIIIIKYYVLSPNKIWLVFMAIISEVLLVYVYIQLFQGRLGITYAFVKIFTVLLVIIAGVMLFSEKIKSTEWIGLGLGVLALIMLAI